MATRTRIPFLVDIVRVSEPAEIFALDADPHVDRRFVGRGPLVSRLIAGRIRRWFSVDDKPLPSLAPRDDSLRQEGQRRLAERLNPEAGEALWTDAQLARLAAYVRGGGSREDAAIAAQEIVGRAFDPGFLADAASWQAASLVDAFRDGFSLRQIGWMISGRLRRAFDLLAHRAGRDRHAMHGIAIGVHGIVGALDRMRELATGPERQSLTEEAALARCLHPPKRVPRMVGAGFNTPASPRRLKAGTLVMLDLETARAAAPGGETAFMHGRWNFCPAEAFATELVRAVWRREVAT